MQPTEWKRADEMGKWGWTAGKWYGDAEDKGIQTSQDARFYGYSAKMNKVFNNEGKDLVLQFTTKYEQDIDCGGAYIKLLPSGTDQESFGGDSKYSIMFGPDICGSCKSIPTLPDLQRTRRRTSFCITRDRTWRALRSSVL